MKEYLSSVSPKGQITIPVEFRRQLGVKPKDKVVFQIVGDVLQVTPARFTLETAYGSVSPRARPEDFERISQDAKAEHAEEVVRRFGR